MELSGPLNYEGLMTASDATTLDSLYRCLASDRRRYILSYVQDTEDSTVSFDDLVDYVVEQETNSPASERECVAIDLYHTHLPMLADHGMIDFDERTKTVKGETPPEVEQLLEVG